MVGLQHPQAGHLDIEAHALLDERVSRGERFELGVGKRRLVNVGGCANGRLRGHDLRYESLLSLYELVEVRVEGAFGDVAVRLHLGIHVALALDAPEALLEVGGRLIDTASYYGNEEAVGRAIRDSGVPREEIFVTTKLYPTEFDDPEGAIEGCLERLEIGYIDLMLLHHPGTGDVEAYHAMEQAVADGKIHSIGLSNWYIEELEVFLPQVNITPAVVQNEIHPYYQEQEVVLYIQSLGIVVNGYSPFGGRGHTSELFADPVISKIAETHGVTSAQVILRWSIQRGVVVNPGSSNPDHIQENLDVFGFTLTSEEMEQIASLERGEKHEWY